MGLQDSEQAPRSRVLVSIQSSSEIIILVVVVVVIITIIKLEKVKI